MDVGSEINRNRLRHAYAFILQLAREAKNEQHSTGNQSRTGTAQASDNHVITKLG